MAGAGYKLFNTGDVLTAAQVNTYLQEQAVMRFASAAARTTALSGVLAEGMVSYLMDTNAVEVYDGSAWVGVGNVGDITGVTAGTGISGGGTSGTVTITNSMATEITAAGDIIVGTGSGTFDNLPIGTTGQVLTADTTVSPYKVKWANAAGGGKVLQVVSSLITSSATIASTTLTDTNITATITPTSSSSKILVLISANVHVSRTAQPANYGASLLRGATEVYDMNNNTYSGVGYAASYTTTSTGTPWGWASYIPTIYLDSPSTTSSTTYKLQANCETTSSTSTIYFQEWAGSTITLMEIGA